MSILRTPFVIIYNQIIRPLLPKRLADYNGVQVESGKVFDDRIPWKVGDRPRYEEAIVDSLHSHVTPGDTIVIVGGGKGVTAVHAACSTGKKGDVVVFEGGREQIQSIRDTLDRADLADRIEVRHAIVGPAISVYSESRDATTITPEDLPNCDVLELDCEGAEAEIIPGMEIRPRVIIVETHGHLGASSEDVKEMLTDRGYDIVSSEIAAPDKRETCEDKDIRVLTGIRN